MKTGLVASPLNVISKSMASHRAAQAVIYADQIQQAKQEKITLNIAGQMYQSDFNAYDNLYVYHGNDWGGTINLFGGLKNYGGIHNFVNFSKFKGKVYSLAIDMPDYYGMMKKRFDGATDYNPEWDEVDWDNLKRMCETAETLIPNDLINYANISIGDSHAICMYRPGWKNISVPFKTLHGALKEGLNSFLPERDSWDHIEFYFGNIDIRHHLCRQENPVEATRRLVENYMHQVHLIAGRCNANVTIYEPLPIENERRSVPKTGWYKGTPFYGSWSERNEIRKLFREEVRAWCDGRVQLYEWVGGMINSTGKLDFECMEKPKSVHLSRAWYPHWQGYQWSHSPVIDYKPIPEKEQESFGLASFL